MMVNFEASSSECCGSVAKLIDLISLAMAFHEFCSWTELIRINYGSARSTARILGWQKEKKSENARYHRVSFGARCKVLIGMRKLLAISMEI